MSIIICAFAGLGKTYLAKKYDNIVDLDIGTYKYKNYGSDYEEREKLKATPNREKNEEYPNNYLSKLIEIMKKEDKIILVPADLEIRDILVRENIKFIFIMPSIDSKQELILRYKKRGNSQEFINRAITDLENWSKLKFSYQTIILPKNKYLEDFLIEEKLILM